MAENENGETIPAPVKTKRGFNIMSIMPFLAIVLVPMLLYFIYELCSLIAPFTIYLIGFFLVDRFLKHIELRKGYKKPVEKKKSKFEEIVNFSVNNWANKKQNGNTKENNGSK